MNTSNLFAKTLADLRKKAGMTQHDLAELLNISNKTVSKWETARALPEITVLPLIANIFGVTIDYLLLGDRKGIAIAGNILVDRVKSIDRYPEPGMVANITDYDRNVGGCVPNTAINLAKIDPSMPISVRGCIGDDESGQYVMTKMHQYGINTSSIMTLQREYTGFSDVMSMPGAGRTAFYAGGANASFSPEFVDVSQLSCDVLHIGYLLLLDKFDAKDAEYGTVMARFLHSVQKRGIKTSVDIASKSNPADYAEKVVPALRYCDYLICNEVECCNCFGLSPRHSDGRLDIFNIKSAMRKVLELGVRRKIIVHAKEACFCLNMHGDFTAVGSVDIPRSEIKGKNGAGDAFSAGCLYSIYNNYPDRKLLEFASAAAACSLSSENAIDGMKNEKDIIRMMRDAKRLSVMESE